MEFSNRREFIGASSAAVATLAMLGCVPERQDSSGAPVAPEIEPDLILDTARFYCERVLSQKTPEDMARDVSVVPFDRFLQEIEKVAGRKMNDRERQEDRYQRLEIVTDEGKVFINRPLFQEVLKEPEKFIPPSSMEQLKGEYDQRKAITESLLIHAFSHVNDNEKTYEFAPFSLRVHEIRVPEVGKLEGYKFRGKQENGTTFYIVGADEAMIELSARTIGRRNGQYIPLARQYMEGSDLVKKVNESAGISSEEFLQYATGQLDQKTFLRKWGALKNASNPDEKAAILALASVGLYVQGAGGTVSDMTNSVEQWLGIKLN